MTTSWAPLVQYFSRNKVFTSQITPLCIPLLMNLHGISRNMTTSHTSLDYPYSLFCFCIGWPSLFNVSLSCLFTYSHSHHYTHVSHTTTFHIFLHYLCASYLYLRPSIYIFFLLVTYVYTYFRSQHCTNFFFMTTSPTSLFYPYSFLST